jgi:hypothetical protein
MGCATATLARKILAAKGTENRQIADGNIALLLLPLSEDALVDEFIYDPARSAGELSLRVVKGEFPTSGVGSKG